MKSLSIALLLLMSGITLADEAKVTVSERPEWQQSVMEKVTFSAKTKGDDEILEGKITQPNHSWGGFIIFCCTAKENLGKRLLWIDAEVVFSNGDKRKFKGINFNIHKKGTELDIAKLPFKSESKVSVRSVYITSVTMK